MCLLAARNAAHGPRADIAVKRCSRQSVGWTQLRIHERRRDNSIRAHTHTHIHARAHLCAAERAPRSNPMRTLFSRASEGGAGGNIMRSPSEPVACLPDHRTAAPCTLGRPNPIVAHFISLAARRSVAACPAGRSTSLWRALIQIVRAHFGRRSPNDTT